MCFTFALGFSKLFGTQGSPSFLFAPFPYHCLLVSFHMNNKLLKLVKITRNCCNLCGTEVIYLISLKSKNGHILLKSENHSFARETCREKSGLRELLKVIIA